TGVRFAQHTNYLLINEPFTANLTDVYSDPYTLTATPERLSEKQKLYNVDIPLMLLFRYIPGRVGFTGRIGAKFGLPMWGTYSLSEGMLQNQVYYPHWDLLMSDVPGVIEDKVIAATSGRTSGWIWTPNSDAYSLSSIVYTGYLEAGLLFQLSQRVDLGLTLFGQYTFTDVKTNSPSQKSLGFGQYTTGVYPSPFTESYTGVWNTNEVPYVRPWSAGIKLSLQFNAGRTQAQKEYDKQRRLAKKEAEQARKDSIQAVKDSIQAELLREKERLAEEERQKKSEEYIRKQKAAALQSIDSIADQWQIDLCKRCHDTIYLYREVFLRDTIYRVDTVLKETPVVEQLDDILRSAVIFFDVNSTVPKLQPTDVLEQIATILRRHPQQRVAIHGHASKEGNPELNKRLSQRRAAVIADMLRALGVQDSQMAIASFGSQKPYKTGKEHSLKQDRRVEIFPLGETRQAQQQKTTNNTPVEYKIRCTEVVRKGSRLAQIARRHYGDPSYWKLLYEANKDVISDPSNIPVGVTLRIPEIPQP
ncbi:MAG: OmpA family protein, partial [Paludibacteraceae bacterium]